MPIPVPPYIEQQEIVEEIERLLSVADEAAKTIDRELKRAEQLRQSILKQAFSGKLVAQDATSGAGNEVRKAVASAAGEQLEMQL